MGTKGALRKKNLSGGKMEEREKKAAQRGKYELTRVHWGRQKRLIIKGQGNRTAGSTGKSVFRGGGKGKNKTIGPPHKLTEAEKNQGEKAKDLLEESWKGTLEQKANGRKNEPTLIFGGATKGVISKSGLKLEECGSKRRPVPRQLKSKLKYEKDPRGGRKVRMKKNKHKGTTGDDGFKMQSFLTLGVCGRKKKKKRCG